MYNLYFEKSQIIGPRDSLGNSILLEVVLTDNVVRFGRLCS